MASQRESDDESTFVQLCVSCGLFKGKTLEEELGFVRYFHHNRCNVWLHVFGFHFFFLFVLIVSASSVPGVDVALVVAYIAGMIALELPHFRVGLCAGIMFTALALLSRLLLLTQSTPTVLWVGVGSGAVGGVLQLFGHIYFDRSQPAFRFFEAFFTTPFYLYLYVMSAVADYRPELLRGVKEQTMRWRGSERVTYGERRFTDD